MKRNFIKGEYKEEKCFKKSLTEKQKFVVRSYGLIAGRPLIFAIVLVIPRFVSYVIDKLGSDEEQLSAIEKSGSVVWAWGENILSSISTIIFYTSFSVAVSFTFALLMVALSGGKYSDDEYKFFVKSFTVIVFLSFLFGMIIFEYILN